MQRTLFAWRGCIDSFFRGCSLSECLSLKGYFYNKNDFQVVNAERKFFCCIIRCSGVRRPAMAQNCRIPGHAGPVRRADFGVCGGAFRIAGAEKADRRSRQSLPFAFFMPGAFGVRHVVFPKSGLLSGDPGLSDAGQSASGGCVFHHRRGMGNISAPQCLQ